MARLRQLQHSLFLTLVSLLPATLTASTTLNMSLPRCPDKCGNITIPYPFGTRSGCYRDGFGITCNESTTPPKLFMGFQPQSNIELIDINVTTGEARAIQPYFSYACYNQIDNKYFNSTSFMNLGFPSVYLFSNQRNKFTTIGCYTLAYIIGNGSYWSGCASYCKSQNSTTGNGGLCNGLGCCQTAIPTGLNYYKVQWGFKNNSAWKYSPCNYAMLVADDWYTFHVQDLSGRSFYERNKNGIPFVLDWAIRFNGTCQDGVENNTKLACLSDHSICNNTSNGEGYLCRCRQGYEGNPYLPGGCIGN